MVETEHTGATGAHDRGGTPSDTRLRLLECACEVFAEKGFHRATHQEICSLAKANIAAVNYYFGSKETLYEEALAEASRRAEQPPGGLELGRTAATDALRCHLHAQITAILDPGPRGWLPRIVHQELTSPTPLAAAVRSTYLSPHVEALVDLVSACLGPGRAREDLRQVAFAVHSQILHLAVARRDTDYAATFALPLSEETPSDTERTRRFAERITEFCLGGIATSRPPRNIGDAGSGNARP